MSTVEDIVKGVQRFRILCVGRSGVGKSSLINRVLGVHSVSVSHFHMGEADIEKEFTSDENEFLVLHDSHRFMPWDTQSFDMVSEFIKKRRNESLPLKERLHAVWLCTETPRAGGRVLETSEERLLHLAHETQTPVVIVLTKYDLLLRTKKTQLRWSNRSLASEALEQRAKEEAQKEFQMSLQSLNSVLGEMPHYAKVSVYPGYEADISSLVDVTGDLIRERYKGDAWVIWAIAQRASLPVKLDACVFAVIARYRRTLAPDSGGISLRDVLTNLHQDIITCWNFEDEEHILSSEAFRRFVLLLVQDVEESWNQEQSHSLPSQAIHQISLDLDVITDAAPHRVPAFAPTSFEASFGTSLSDSFSSNKAQALRLFMTYSVDFTALLRSLFHVRSMGELSSKLTWLDLKRAYEKYESSGSRQKIHRHICATFQHAQQILDTSSFQRTYVELVKGEGSDWDENRAQNWISQVAKDPSPPPSTPVRKSWLRRISARSSQRS